MEPFESIHTSNFIFTFGYLARKAGLELPRQTAGMVSQDNGARIADAIASWRGRNFIIEFRRSENRVGAEFRTPHKRRLLEALNSPEGSALRRLSRRGHFIAYGIADRRIGGLVFMRYFEATDSASQSGSHLGVSPFFEGIVSSRSAGLGPEEFKQYVAEAMTICAPRSSKDHSESEVPPVPALILNCEPTTKGMRFACADLMRLLDLPPGQEATSRSPQVLR
jgi:hypothetical protein